MIQRKIFCFWTGDNEIPEIRRRGVESLADSGLEVVLITNRNLHEFIPQEKLHPAYYALNLAHRADYLRAYFMHHFGGAYCDIKPLTSSWIATIEQLENNKFLLAAGYPEVGRWGVGNCYQSAILLNEGGIFNKLYYYVKYRFLQLNYTKLIGNGAFIFKPKTCITQIWWNELNSRLDKLHDKLLAHPAKYPKERMGHVYDGVVSQYPVPWSYLLGDILAPLILKHSSKVLKNLPPPSFENYQ